MLEQRWSIWRIYTANVFAIERTPTRSSSKRQLHRVRALTKLPPWPSVTWRRERVSRCARCQAQKIHSTSVLQVSISVSECVSVCGCLCVWKFCFFFVSADAHFPICGTHSRQYSTHNGTQMWACMQTVFENIVRTTYTRTRCTGLNPFIRVPGNLVFALRRFSITTNKQAV